jgi:tetratricopeptide (TPR) repeat protein
MLNGCRTLGVWTSILLGLSATGAPAADDPKPAETKMPMTGLAPDKIHPVLCGVKYRVSTTTSECQAFFDQGLGYFYSYVWMEASRSFETATRHDPDCALAWWGLSRALERWGKRNESTKALLKADALKDRASHREQQLILARMQEKGQAPGVGDAEKRKQAAIQTLDNMLALYDDDEEAWYYRAQMAGGSGLFGGQASSVPFYKALLLVNPMHPGANHEMVHYYEKCQRPALGWVYAENYIKSSPGLPHAFHMQAHLATRLGRWDKTSDRSARAIELERAYHQAMNVKPKDDHQYSHHLETLLTSLIHDGRFREAHAIKKEAWDSGYRHWLPWFRLYLAEGDVAEALKVADHFRKSDKLTASYLASLVYLRQGETSRAAPEVEVLQHAYQDRKSDRTLELRLWETQGLLMCQMGAADGGLKLLEKAVKASKDNYLHHAWGNGAYYMEPWAIAALHAGRPEIAEEAFLEALAHDRGSVRATLGLQVLCERQSRPEEAARYAEMAQRCWSRAEVQSLAAEMAYMRGENSSVKTLKAQREENKDARPANGTAKIREN